MVSEDFSYYVLASFRKVVGVLGAQRQHRNDYSRRRHHQQRKYHLRQSQSS